MSKRDRPQKLRTRSVVTSGNTGRLYTKCPKCRAELQATVPFYLSEVQVDRDGFIINYTPAYENAKDCINLDEPDLTQIYCANDHLFIPPTSKKAIPGKQSKRSTKQARKN
jgi:hypothetical protein